MKIRFMFIAVIAAGMMTLVSGCRGCGEEKPYTVKTFQSADELVQAVVPLFNSGDGKAIHAALIQKEFYVDKIYPNTAEGRSPGHMSGEDFWKSIINLKRPYNIHKNIEKYRGRIDSIEEIGEPKHVVEFGPYKYLRHVRVKLKVKNKQGVVESIEDDDLIGIIVQDSESGKFMFMNTFN